MNCKLGKIVNALVRDFFRKDRERLVHARRGQGAGAGGPFDAPTHDFSVRKASISLIAARLDSVNIMYKGIQFSLYLNIDAAPAIRDCCLDDTSALLPSRVQCPHSWTLIFSIETPQTFSTMSKKVLNVSMEASLETDPLRAPEARDRSGCRSRRSRVAAESACARDCFQKHSVESTSLSIASSSDIR